MALESLFRMYKHLYEHYTFQVLIDHPRLPCAYKLAKSFMHSPIPYSFALTSLRAKYGQPRQAIQSEIASILNTHLSDLEITLYKSISYLSIHSLECSNLLRVMRAMNFVVAHVLTDCSVSCLPIIMSASLSTVSHIRWHWKDL